MVHNLCRAVNQVRQMRWPSGLKTVQLGSSSAILVFHGQIQNMGRSAIGADDLDLSAVHSKSDSAV